jgi:hypothetical protein
MVFSVDQNCVDKLEDTLAAALTEVRRTRNGTTSLNLEDIPGKLRE